MIDAAKFQAICEILDTRFPGLSSFADPRFEREEISYKKRAIETAQDRLSSAALTELLHRKDHEGFIKGLEEVGKKTNLLYLSVPTAGDLGVLYQPDLDKASFTAAVFDLLHGKGNTEDRLDAYSVYVRDRSLPNKWTFPTYFLFMLYPESEFFVKPSYTNRFLTMLGQEPLQSSPNADDYRRLKTVVADLKQAFTAFGPRDMVDLQSVLFVCARQKTSRLLSPERSAELANLFAQFVPEYLETTDGKVHRALYGEGRISGRTNWEEVQDLAARKKDITDAVLLKLLPYADSPANRKLGAWVNIAPCITDDLQGWFEAKGWTKASDWPHVARAIFDFVTQCTADPGNLAQACSRFADSPYSKGFQAGMLSPILHALAPEHFHLINSKVRRALKYLTDSDVSPGIISYPEANGKLQQLLDETEDLIGDYSLGELSHAEAFDAFCHWLVAVKKHPFRDTRYWKIAPGEDALNWSNCLSGGYIAMGWEDLGDVSEMSRQEFVARMEEAISEHPDWKKARLEQVWKFSRINEGDSIVANQGTSRLMGIGTVVGPYYFVANERYGHRLPVEWNDTKPRDISEGGWRKTLIELDRDKFQELAGLPPVLPTAAFLAPEAFSLLRELRAQPTRAFYDSKKSSFHELVEQPLQVLLLGAAEQVPEAMRVFLETRSGIFSRIPKNDFGRGGTWDHYWGALFPKGARRIESVQFFVSVNADELSFGFSLGEYAATDRERFVANWRKHGDALRAILRDTLMDERLTFGTQPGGGNAALVSRDEWLKDPAATDLQVRVHLLAADAVRAKREELVADVSRTFQTLYPLVLVATSAEPLAAIRAFLEPEVDMALERRPEYTLDSMAAETLVPKDELERWENSLDRKKQVILYGPPGTGKTFMARKLANHVVGGTDGFADLVQFHPSYSYEDFLQGIRPRTTVEGGLTYALQDGTFKRFCDRARARTGPCVLVIDEINRANLSRVFGELMYLLEYRGDEIPVAYGGTFGIPDNVFIIATMNTADRSIALVDHALRRRFAFIRLAPNYEILRRYLQNGGYQPDGLIEVLKEVNSEIRDEDYHLGISFFLTAELPEHIEDIWRMEIEPYLEEYFFDNRDKLSRFRWDAIKGRVAV